MTMHENTSKIPDVPNRAGQRQTIPIAEEFQDTPPPYEPSASAATTTSPKLPTPPSSARLSVHSSSSSSHRDANSGLLHSRSRQDGYESEENLGPRPIGAAAPALAAGYTRNQPMGVEADKWARLENTPGCCFSDSGGCCFSSTGGCCFSDTGGCCFSDHEACCFSSNQGCCCSSGTRS